MWNGDRHYFLGQGDWEFEKSLLNNEIIVDITKYIDKRTEALSKFVSQFGPEISAVPC